MGESSAEVVRRYLQDAIAAARAFEAQLHRFAEEGDDDAAKQMFHQHTLETKSRSERLTDRLQNLGGSTSGTKSFLSHVFSPSFKTAQTAPGRLRTTENLIAAFTAENSEAVLFEALFSVSEAAGDPETASLALALQNEAKSTAEKFWHLLPASVLRDAAHPAGQTAEG